MRGYEMFKWRRRQRFIHGELQVYYSLNCTNCRRVLGFDVIVDEEGDIRIKWLEPTNFRKTLEMLKKKRLYDYRLLNISEGEVADEVYSRTKMYRFWLPLVIGRKIVGECWEGVKPDLSVEEYMDILLGRVPPPEPVSVYAYSR